MNAAAAATPALLIAALSLAAAPAHAQGHGGLLGFASGLEEALGHLYALERNLDEGNAELALVHARHPVEELYLAMKPQLAAEDPGLDARVQETLLELQHRTGEEVPVSRAKAALGEARGVVEEARSAIVGDELSSDPAFRAELIRALLETSVAEYREGVADGQIVNAPEFQDGSAFVWRARQISEATPELPGQAAAEIGRLYDGLEAAYAARADPSEIADVSGEIIAATAQAARQERLGIASGLEETLGHLYALERNLDEGNAALALAHALHPVEELYTAMRPQLEAADPALDAQVQRTLLELKDRTGEGVSLAQAKAALGEARAVVEVARTATVGEFLSADAAFRADLIRILLETSVAEYQEGVEDGQIINVPEFQDGSAFVWKARQLSEGTPEISGQAAGDIGRLYDRLEAAYRDRADSSVVAGVSEEIMAATNSAVGLGAALGETDLLAYVENIRGLLMDADAAYASGDVDLAQSLAVRAYLDNYEFLEGPLVDAGERELMEDVEHMLREDLRAAMGAGAPPEQVSAEIAAILDRMDDVAAIVPEFGAVAAAVLAAAAAAAVALTARSRIAMPPGP